MSEAPIRAENVVVDGLLVTGQNPWSADLLGSKFVQVLASVNATVHPRDETGQ